MPRSNPPDPADDQTGPFPEERSVHETILSSPDEYPSGWVDQARFRERYDLPPFRPPRFADDVRVASVVESLEEAYSVTISLVAYDVRGEGWWIEIDGEPAFQVQRYRDDAANTVVETTSDEFEERCRDAVGESGVEE